MESILFDPTPIGASLSATIADFTLSADGAIASDRSGDLSATIVPVTLGSTGTLAISGTLASTLPAVTASSGAKLAIRGSLAQTIPAVTVSAAAKLPITGSLGLTINPVTSAANSVLPIIGNVTGYRVDTDWSSVLLLAGYNGANNATASLDESDYGRTATFSGTAKLSTTKTKFGATSANISTGVGAINYANSDLFKVASTSTRPYTIEMWVNFDTLGTTKSLAEYIGGSAGVSAWRIRLTSANVLEFVVYQTAGTTLSYDWSGSVATDTWYHLVAERDGTGTGRIYIDGVMVASANLTGVMSNPVFSTLIVGNNVASSTAPLGGYIDEFRITGGVARYASDAGFVVPDQAFPRPDDLIFGPFTLSAAGGEPSGITGSLGATIDAVALSSAGSSNVIAFPEVNWPGTKIPRSKFKAMQREALVQYLNAERQRLDEQPSKRAVKKAVARVIEQAIGAGLLSPENIAEARSDMAMAIQSNTSIYDILNRLNSERWMLKAMEQAALDDEAAAFLLMAA